MQIQAQEILKLRAMLNRIYVDCCDQDIEEVEARLDRDTFMNPVEALDWGIIDEVVYTRKGSKTENNDE